MAYKILAINPGSTSTKISVANNCEPLFVEDVKHSRSELEHFHTIFDQYEGNAYFRNCNNVTFPSISMR